MDFQSLDLWWPETGDTMAEEAFQPIFSPLPTHYAEFLMGGAAVENWWEGNGSINITDSPSVEVENVNSMGGGGGMVNEEEGLMEEGVTNHGENAAQGCKNLLSERNRRKRLNQQLIALRSLVPYMSKTGCEIKSDGPTNPTARPNRFLTMNIEMPAIVTRMHRLVLNTDELLLANGDGEMELDLEDLSFWLPDSVVGATMDTTEDLADLIPYPASSAQIFSPLPREYGSFLEAMELDFSLEDEESPSPPSGPANPAATAEGGVSGCGQVRRRKRTAVEDELDDDPGISAGCKNLLSERNRRRRLNQQLLALRSLVPCISKMDKRSILMDAATYIQNLLREIEEVKSEIAEQERCHDQSPASSESNLTSPDMSPPPHEEASSDHHHIFKIETDEMDDRTISVKVEFGKARGAAAQVQRIIESLGTTVTHTWTHEMEGHRMITTSFISLKKQMNLTAEMLKEQMNKAALRMGFEIDLDD